MRAVGEFEFEFFFCLYTKELIDCNVYNYCNKMFLSIDRIRQ